MSRLEEIKGILNSPGQVFFGSISVDGEVSQEVADAEPYFKWLINRVEELEKNLNITNQSWKSMQAENQRYKQALKFYADEHNWDVHQLTDGVLDGENIVPPEYEPAWAYADEGEIARQALKGESE